MVTVTRVRGALPNLEGLVNQQITEGITMGKKFLDGLNPDWSGLPQSEDIHLYAACLMVLQLHYPTETSQFRSMEGIVRDMVTSPSPYIQGMTSNKVFIRKVDKK